MIGLALAGLMAIAQPTTTDGVVLTGLLATAAAEVDGVDVLTPADLRAALSLEGERQVMGCSASESCLAEIAAALDARAVLFGSLGRLGDELVLQLNLFDSQRATSVGRAAVRGRDTSALAGQAEEKVKAMVSAFHATTGQTVRVLVLDLEVVGGVSSADAPVAADAPGLPWLAIGGGAVVSLGALGVVIGAISDTQAVDSAARAADPGLSVKEARAAYAESDGAATVALVGYLGGAALIVGGAALLVVGLGE